MLLTEGDMGLLGEDEQPQPLAMESGDAEGSWMARILSEAHSCMKNRGSSVGSGRMLSTFLSRRTDLVGSQCVDILANIGAWKKGPTPQATAHYDCIGNLMRKNAMEYVRSLSLFLRQEGYPPGLVDRLVKGTDEELADLRVHMYSVWHYAWAEKASSDTADYFCPSMFASPQRTLGSP